MIVQTKSLITVTPTPGKETLDGSLRTLKEALPNVVIKVGISNLLNIKYI